MSGDPAKKITYPDLDIFTKRFDAYTERDKPNISPDLLKGKGACATKAVGMARDLIDKGCSVEIAIELSILTLYDLVVLIDDSSSMKIEESGKRIDTLKAVLGQIAEIYQLANDAGIKSVRFLNHRQGKGSVKAADVDAVLNRPAYTGLTMIGTELRKKILAPFVLNAKMEKPLLVMIITDGQVEGERSGLLTDVILDCVGEVTDTPGKLKDAVTFHFSRVGNDPGAKELIENLDHHEKVGDLIDCLPTDMILDHIGDPAVWQHEKWRVLPKMLLGAILPYMDESDEDLSLTGKASILVNNPVVEDVLADD